MSTIPLLRPWCAVLLVGMACGWTGSPSGTADPPPPAVSTVLAGVPLQLLLRTADGTPVPSIEVALVPAAADAGGPPAGTPGQQGITDRSGMFTFGEVQGAIWSARFQGTYQGQPLVPVAAQGQPPYGTTRGGGLVVQTALQEENDAPAPVVGQLAPAVEVLAFVLLPTGTDWTPAIDLAAPGTPPQPLTMVVPRPAPVVFAPTLVDPPPDPGRGADLPPLVWVLPLSAAGGALLVTWRQRRTAQAALTVPDRWVPSTEQEGNADVD